MEKLYIFDFDDTLCVTSAKIKVKSTGERITSAEMSINYMDKEDDLDFSDFRSDELIEPVYPNKRIIKIFKQSVAENGIDNVVIVTARRNPNPIKQFLKSFKLPNVRIYFISNDNMPSSEQKKNIIKRIVKQGKYTEIVAFDDAEENLHSIQSLENENLSVMCFKVEKEHITPYNTLMN